MNEPLRELYRTKFPGWGYENIEGVGVEGKYLTGPAARLRGTTNTNTNTDTWEKVKEFLTAKALWNIPNWGWLVGGAGLIVLVGVIASKER